MISKEHKESFTLTEQLHHSIVSGEMLTHWKYQNIKNSAFYPSVHYAISMHDYGWQNFDKQPFWNDRTQQPYSFIDFPMMAKLVLYQHGIDVIEKEIPMRLSCAAVIIKTFLLKKKLLLLNNLCSMRNSVSSRSKRLCLISMKHNFCIILGCLIS